MPPISYLRLHGIEDVRVRRVPYAPAFFFAYTSPDSDTDQSAQMTADGVVEPGMTQVGDVCSSGWIVLCGYWSVVADRLLE